MELSDLPQPHHIDNLADTTDVHDWEPADIAATLQQIRAIRRSYTTLHDTIETQLVAVLDGKRRTELEGCVLEVRAGRKRSKWKVDELLPFVFRGLIDPDQTGVLSSPGEIVERLRVGLPEVVPMTPSTGFKVTGLRPLLEGFGHDLDEFCESVPGRATVQITEAPK